ncbi:hypothetical protein CVT24_004775 [Panaeolus cyanescens]|uniref:Uncharacterized protein n=1 Tax=Panaeolus cyanescens TaxID=181874 RepID=A0A409VD75_9AGAR|nr:hypothetical protein CVT24_004775 [Panaeolus cyanescens]
MATSSGEELTPGNRNCLPGFGLPLNYAPCEGDEGYCGELYPNALSLQCLKTGRTVLPMISLREIAMLQFMNTVTDKVDWHIKVHDDDIVKKWETEVSHQYPDFTSKMFSYCIQELRHRATFVSKSVIPPPIVVYDANVVKSDFAVSPEVKKDLQDAMQEFEDGIPDRLKDWHPFSDDKVLDLVHPSLFPIIYGTTRILEHGTTTLEDCILRCGSGRVLPVPPVAEEVEEKQKSTYRFVFDDIDTTLSLYSRKFQWLPCEVDISGEHCKITSYINNLHPQETKLYALIAKIIDAAIPLWELTLPPVKDRRIDLPPKRISYTFVEYDPFPEEGPDTDGPQQLPGEDENDFWERRSEWFDSTRKVVLPEPGDFEARSPCKSTNIREIYGERGLQVIVKLANIMLTPDKPSYEGGSWHVEGQLNEHIVSTALYYYSSHNITPSFLAFRQQVSTTYEDMGVSYEQNIHDWLDEVFGCTQDGPGVQDIGSVETREGRLLTFPNVLQHRVEPFELADPTKPGHRKILALFLVDPNIKIISTAHVPCQRKDWWAPAVVEQQSAGSHPTPLGELPTELLTEVFKGVEDFPLSMEEAMTLRLELMDERRVHAETQDDGFQINTFNLCEH